MHRNHFIPFSNAQKQNEKKKQLQENVREKKGYQNMQRLYK